MKKAARLICAMLFPGLVVVPAHTAPPASSSSRNVAKFKPVAKSKPVPRASAKRNPRAKLGAAARAATPPAPPESTAGDEVALNKEVALARARLGVAPGDQEARRHLARAAVTAIDWLLAAEAVGDADKAERLAGFLRTELHDTGWRVQLMGRNGDLKARQATGFLLGHGILLAKDAERSCVEFRAAAEQFAPSAWRAAQCQINAAPERAWAHMARAAEAGHAAAQEWMGRRCLGEFGATEKDYGCARSWLSQSASQGRSRAQTLLGYLLTSGLGGAVDVPRAIRLYTLAAEQGDADAQNNLGEIKESGRGVDRNLEEAMGWYEKAALRGSASAQYNAGRLWAIGTGGMHDPAKARAYLLQAQDHGIAQARQILEWLERQAATAADAASGNGAGGSATGISEDAKPD